MRAGLLGLVIFAGCNHSPTTVALDLQLAAGAPPPASMMVSVFDRHHALALQRPIDHAPPGTVVLIVPDEAQPLRAVVAGGGLLGGARAETTPFREVRAGITLAADTADGDGDGVPDEVDNCPTVPNPDQQSAAGDAGDACSNAPVDAGADLADLATPDLSKVDLAPPPDLAPALLLYDNFTGAALDPNKWAVQTAGGATVTQAGAMLTLNVPAAANALADVSSKLTFPVGTTVEMKVTFSAGQFYDHHVLGYASAPVGPDCNLEAASEAVAFRGQDTARLFEAKTGNTNTCGSAYVSNYPAGTHVLKVLRPTTGGVQFYEDGALVGVLTTTLPTGPVPVRFSVFTYATAAPTTPITLSIQYVKVTMP